jgi:hypothetical protein
MKLSRCSFQNITAMVGILGMIFWGTCGYLWGKHVEEDRWKKATADWVFHCVQPHGPIQPQSNSPDEKASIVPTEEDRNAALISAEQ